MNNKKILFAVLNWGLGHATRSWELINNLHEDGHEVILASDGEALKFLKLEFPKLEAHNLPSYNAKYGVSGGIFPMLKNAIKTQKAVREEQTWLKEFLVKNNIDQIISDNRYGIFSPDVESIIITHQLNIKVPFASKIVNAQNRKWLNRFDQIWVPDQNGELSGELSNPVPLKLKSKVKEIGWLSRFKNAPNIETSNVIMAVVSGPEPQKTILVDKLRSVLLEYKGESILYTGLPGEKKEEKIHNLTIKNHAHTSEFMADLQSAKLVMGRSGYSSLMDYMVLGKNMILIPTPGQDEQIYLGNYLKNKAEVTLISQMNVNFASFLSCINETN